MENWQQSNCEEVVNESERRLGCGVNPLRLQCIFRPNDGTIPTKVKPRIFLPSPDNFFYWSANPPLESML
jgi:hypothetical protein